MQACRTATTVLGNMVGRFVADERAATAIEYAMIAGGVGLAVASTVWNVGSTMKSMFYDKLAAAFP